MRFTLWILFYGMASSNKKPRRSVDRCYVIKATGAAAVIPPRRVLARVWAGTPCALYGGRGLLTVISDTLISTLNFSKINQLPY